jgi:hypothetical protein
LELLKGGEKIMKKTLILFALAVFLSACGANQPKNAAVVAPENKSANTTPANKNETTSETEKPNRDLTPVTVTAGSLFTGNYRYTSEVEEFKTRYADRVMTISGLYLWEVSMSEITATDKKEAGGNFVKCAGSFSEYSDSAGKIREIREKGNPMKATLRGTMKSARDFTSAGQLEITLTDCVLAEIEK